MLLMGKSTISMAMFNSFLYVYQRLIYGPVRGAIAPPWPNGPRTWGWTPLSWPRAPRTWDIWSSESRRSRSLGLIETSWCYKKCVVYIWCTYMWWMYVMYVMNGMYVMNEMCVMNWMYVLCVMYVWTVVNVLYSSYVTYVL